MITVAPELPGATGLIAAARAAGVVVSLGHSAATSTARWRRWSDGAALVTHLFNGMPPLHHRRPGLVGAALTCPALTCELIADGLHVDPAVVRLAVAATGTDRIALVTDCLSAAGLPEGEHELGSGTRITVTDGLATVSGTDTIAGSTLTMDRASGTSSGSPASAWSRPRGSPRRRRPGCWPCRGSPAGSRPAAWPTSSSSTRS